MKKNKKIKKQKKNNLRPFFHSHKINEKTELKEEKKGINNKKEERNIETQQTQT